MKDWWLLSVEVLQYSEKIVCPAQDLRLWERTAAQIEQLCQMYPGMNSITRKSPSFSLK